MIPFPPYQSDFYRVKRMSAPLKCPATATAAWACWPGGRCCAPKSSSLFANLVPCCPIFRQYDRNNTGTVSVADLPALLTELGVDDAAAQDVLGKVPADGAVTLGELQRLLSGEQQLPSEAPDPKVMEFLRILDEPVGGNLLLLELLPMPPNAPPCCRWLLGWPNS